jgi:hypothetical protein
MFLFWAPLAAASAHIFEEFVWPGGFTRWYHAYHPDIAPSASPRFIFWINVALLFGCVSVGVDRNTPIGPAFFLTMIALLGGNGLFHLYATFRDRRYSPGVVTGMTLYVPLAAYGFFAILSTSRASIPTAALAAAIGLSYHVAAVANHRRRARSVVA